MNIHYFENNNLVFTKKVLAHILKTCVVNGVNYFNFE